ncbi:MAG: DUF6078 family protein [Prevotella sp.]|nr:DUF6078 family protein [Prevotella sp.]
MTEQETIFSEKAASYLVCFNEQCGKHKQCLRWQVGQYVPQELVACKCINPNNEQVVAGSCPVFRIAKPTRMAVGMRGFYHDMPGWQERVIKNNLIDIYTRTGYYRYHNGSKPIPPDVEEKIRAVCQKQGWDKPLHFDGYVESYQW